MNAWPRPALASSRAWSWSLPRHAAPTRQEAAPESGGALCGGVAALRRQGPAEYPEHPAVRGARSHPDCVPTLSVPGVPAGKTRNSLMKSNGDSDPADISARRVCSGKTACVCVCLCVRACVFV